MHVSLTDSVGSVAESRFRAMGSDIHLIIVGAAEALLDVAAARIEQLEASWSRFRDNSEVTLLNRCAGAPVHVSADTVLLVERAIEAWRITGGGFDPLVLDDVVRAGYDRSFDEIERTGFETAPTEPGAEARYLRLDRPTCTDIVLGDGTITLPRGASFDPGGIGKGLAADLVAAELVGLGASGVCVNMGGDVRVIGSAPGGSGWTLAIEHPLSSAPIALVGLTGGAVATSSVLKRHWDVDGVSRHHLIDPATGEPSESDISLASVIAGEAWEAEVLAKAVLLRGVERAFDLLDEWTAAVVVEADGTTHCSSLFEDFTGRVQVAATVAFDIDPIATGARS